MVVAFVEDPGAANFVAALARPLAEAGLCVEVFAEGAGARQLGRLGTAHSPLTAAERSLEGAAAVLVGTSEDPDALGHNLVANAQRRGIVTIGVVDAPSNATHRFRGRTDDPLTFAPDWLLVPDDATRAAFVALGHPGDRIEVVPHPHLAVVAARRPQLERAGRPALKARHFPAAGNAPVVVFLSELSDGLDPASFRRSADYTLAGWGDDDRRTHIVLQEVLDAVAELDPRPHCVLRLHPKDRAADYVRYADRIDQVSAEEPAIEIVFAADLVVGMSTMLLAEAAILGRPVLSVLPRESERAWLPAEIGPQLPWASSRPGIRRAIRQMIEGARAIDLPAFAPDRAARRAAREVVKTVMAASSKWPASKERR